MKNVSCVIYDNLYDRIQVKFERKIPWYVNDAGREYNYLHRCLITLWAMTR